MELRTALALVRSSTRGEDALLAAIAACRGFDEEAFLAFARREKLLPWIAPVGAAPAAGEVLSALALEELTRCRAESEQRVATLVATYAELRDHLVAAGIESLVFKGVASGRLFYPDPARRWQRDVDVVVRREHVRPALAVMESLGYDVTREANRGRSMEHKVRRMLEAPLYLRLILQDPSHAATVQRGHEKVDLHWCLKGRYVRNVPAERLWAGRRTIEVLGTRIDTLSEHDTLLALLLILAEDLRRSACKTKLFLDLDLATGGLERDGDWEAFLARLAADELERLAVNVLALYLDLWGAAATRPRLAAALARRRHLIETLTSEEAEAIVSRPRYSRANKVWSRRIYASTRLRNAVFRTTQDLPRTLARAAGRRRTALQLGPAGGDGASR